MSKKKRNKKYNPKKVAIKLVDYSLKDICMIYSTGGDGLVRLINFRTGQEVSTITKHGRNLANDLNNLQHQWTFILAAFSRDSNKKNKMNLLDYPMPCKMFRDDVVHSINEEHRKFTDSFRQELLCGAGWIAAPWFIEDDYDQSFIEGLFSKYGAFSCPTAKEEALANE